MGSNPTPSASTARQIFFHRRSSHVLEPRRFETPFVPILIATVQLPPFDSGDLFVDQLPWALTYTYDFYHAWIGFARNGIFSHVWSLAVEEQFYLLFPFLILHLAPETLKRVFVVIAFLGPAIRYATWFASETRLLPFLGLEPDMVVYVLPFSHVDAFVIGGFVALYLRDYVPSGRLLLICLLAVVGTGLLASKFTIDDWHFASLGYPMFMKPALQYVWGYSLFAVAFALFLLRLRRRDFCQPIFENAWLSYLGRISYGLYIVHLPAIVLTHKWMDIPLLEGAPINAERVLSILLALGLTVAVSVLSFELFERHFLALKEIFFAKESPPPRV
ncbi:hypothetical protein BH18VER1_BH18VER1_11040 [soil metagenome]